MPIDLSMHDPDKYYAIAGLERAGQTPPSSVRRVYFKRALTGGATIYLFTAPPTDDCVDLGYHSFGWIPAAIAQNILLNGKEGWCNYYPGGVNNPHPKRIVFTDDINKHVSMAPARERTNFGRQKAHWLTAVLPVAVASQPQPENKEVNMGNFDPYTAAAEQAARLNPQKGKNVSNLKTLCTGTLHNAVENNKSAAADAGFLTAGQIANNQIGKLVSGHIPMMLRGYASTPLGKLVTANIAQLLIQHFKPNNKAANRLGDAMVTQAYAELIATAGLEELVDNFLSDPKLAKALKVVDQD